MKKATFTMAVALLGAAAPATGLAQGIGFGIRAGVNMAEIGGDYYLDAGLSSRFGAAAGVFLNFGVSPVFSIQPELLYSQKGASLEATFLGETLDLDIEEDYLEVPVLLRYAFPMPGSAVRPVIFAGPAAGLLLSAKVDNEDIKDDTRSFDLGAIFGAGLEFGQVSIDARYNLGLLTIDDTDAGIDAKNRVLTLTVGYTIPLGR